MKKSIGFILVLLFFMSIVLLAGRGNTAVSAQQIQSANGGVPTLTATEFADDFNNPVAIAHAGDERLFIVEKRGEIHILNANGTTEATPFLDIKDRVRLNSEQGLLGLAFDPDYETNGYFYVNYTHCTNSSCANYGETPNLYTRVSRFTVTADPNVADPASELILLTVQQPYGNHNGGDLKFGPDGYLYIGLGDGGDGGDPDNYSQSMDELLGKMLRIDVDPTAGNAPDCDLGGNYSIPTDNPFVGQANVCDEIWASGLRNPWRYSFDLQTGDLFIADVGQGQWEEVNYQPADSTGGENYGWRCYEGTHAYNTSGCLPIGNYEMPFYDYSHSNGISVTGGFVYRGTQSPALNGYYIFTDYGSGNFWLSQDSGGWSTTSVGTLSGIGSPSSFGEDCYGELYVADISGGEIFKLAATAPTTSIMGAVLDEFIYLPLIIGGSGSAVTCN